MLVKIVSGKFSLDCGYKVVVLQFWSNIKVIVKDLGTKLPERRKPDES